MNRFIVADASRCIGCHTCEAACAEAHRQVGLQSLPRLQLMQSYHDSAPQTCRHCEDAPCASVCPVNAIRHTGDAIQLNESLCVSCKLCAIACPFGAIGVAGSRPVGIPPQVITPLAPEPPAAAPAVSPLLDWVPGIRAVAVKCDLCHFSPEGPACVKVCPTRALQLLTPQVVSGASERKRRQAASVTNTPLSQGGADGY